MDWSVYGKKGWFHSGSTDGGRIEGSIWEVSTVLTFARAYDQVKSGLWDQPELYTFLADRGRQFRLPSAKGGYDELVGNIEKNLLAEFVKAVKTGRQIYGNEGDPQHCVAISAIALNREPLTGEWLDWLFDEGTVGQGALKPGEGGHVPALIVATIDRDGVGAEGAPGYSLGWGAALGATANLIRDYEKYDRHDLYRDYPMFKQTITAGWRLAVLASTTPNIGDAGACGSRGGIIAGDPGFIARGYKYLGDPTIGLVAGWANHGRTEGLARDILAPDPDWVAKDIQRLLDEHGVEPPIAGSNRPGYGLVSLEFPPRDTGQALWMYYGLNTVAGHASELQCGFDSGGITVLPPPGYRELWGDWPKSVEWENSTVSHNTVVVNEQQQTALRVGQPVCFTQFDSFGGFCVDSREAYSGVATRYERTMALMKVGDGSYALDVFRVEGGEDHLYSYHALPGPVEVTGLTFTPQQGSYAGPDVPYGTSIRGQRMGYSWFDSVERDDAPAEHFTLDVRGTPPYWGLKQSDDLHVRYHGFTRYTDVALADGHPPANSGDQQPKTIRYLLAHHAGDGGLATTCVGLVEPYRGNPLIKTAQRLAVTGDAGAREAVALRIELTDGTVDYLLSGPDDETLYRAQDGPTFSGRLAALRVRGGTVVGAWLLRGARVTLGDFSLTLPAAGYVGKVSDFDKGLVPRGHILTETPLPLGDTLKGSEIIVRNDRELNACYTIQGVQRQGELYSIDCGDVCFVRGFQDLKDYDKGYAYNLDEGAEFIIPTRASLEAGPGGVLSLTANTEAELALPSR